MDGSTRALVELRRDGSRREWSFHEVDAAASGFAAHLSALGVHRGDVVMTLIGNRPEWVISLVACFRIGAVALPCTEQLRAGDLRARLALAKPRVVVCDERNLSELTAAGWSGETLIAPDPELFETAVGGVTGQLASNTELRPTDPALITFTSGTTGAAKGIVHGRRYVTGQALQAEHWLAPGRGELVWCTAATGWSKSARNVFIAPWLRGAAALLHDARFDPHQRLEILAREEVNVLCMAPTEYRVIAKRATLERYPALRGLVAAGEALNPEVLRAWEEATGLQIRDGYGQTETGQLTGTPLSGTARPGSMGRPLPGVDLVVQDGELVLRTPLSDPTFFVGYLGGEPAPDEQPWRTGDRVQQDEDGYLYFVGRSDDVIISSGYRIGPFEVESALVSHAAVAEAAAVAAPDQERGSVVRAVVVLRQGVAPSDALARELQEWVKTQTAPYKYPRIVEFVAELPKTESGKVQRARLRAE
jgi:acetyl-CoA synthetase